WNGDTRQATLSNANYTVVVTIDSATFTVNGMPHTLEVPAQIIGGSTMLPLRAVLEPVGFDLGWNGETQLITVTSATPQVAITPPPTPEPPAQPPATEELTSLSNYTIFIDGQATNLGDTLREWNGWHFVEARAFADVFGFAIFEDDTSMRVGVLQRSVRFTLNEMTDEQQFDNRLTLNFSTLVNRDFQNIYPGASVIYWSQFVAGETAGFDGFWEVGSASFPVGVVLEVLHNIQDTRVLAGGLDENNYENFPLSWVINGNMYIPFEIANWLLGYTITTADNAFPCGYNDYYIAA
ncbi:MAG: copper amine oxidase N-terminal domain-containing protein, partial [Turicibacter sp.]|nr:copper amine oxidase N-terminal domain-containing protein [Turicibacter sp.]